MSWHQGNVIPHCLCNPEKLCSKETHSVKKLNTLFYSTLRRQNVTHSEIFILTRITDNTSNAV